MQKVHYIMVIAASLGAGLPITSQAFPMFTRAYFLGAAAVCVLVATVCGAVSDRVQLKGKVQS